MFGEYAELSWGLPVVLYLFLAGLGSGALITSASILLRGPSGAIGKTYMKVARYGALIAPFPLIIGCGLLILELGSFQTGHWFRFLYLYTVLNLSPMSVGTWLLTLFIPVSIGYAATFFAWPAPFEAKRALLRRILAWIGLPFGIAVAVYTGVLLGAMPARPFWNTPILALLFLISSISTGIASVLLVRNIYENRVSDKAKLTRMRNSDYILTATDVIFIGFELMVVFLFIMYAHLTIGGVQIAISVVLPGGELASLFWIGFVLIGLIIPGLIEMFAVAPRLLFGRKFHSTLTMDIVAASAVLIGGFLLRYVVLIAGQITGPVGI